MTKKNILLLALLVIICACTGGCFVGSVEPLQYYRHPGFDLRLTSRVVMLELDNKTGNPGLGNELTMALSEEIQRKQIFGLDSIYMADPKWKSFNLSSGSDLPIEKLSEIQTKFKSDAVLYGTVVHYRPYPSTSVGLKLKLIDCLTGELLWAIERVWDSTDADTEARVKAFYKKNMRSAYDPLEWKMVMLSPRMYNKFITNEISETLE